MLKLIGESDCIETVGEMLDVLAKYPRDTPLTDPLGEALIVREQEDMETMMRLLEVE